MTHLHVHSHFSLLAATPSPQALAEQAAADGLTHLALTDDSALYGAVAFANACRAAGVQPIIGMTVRVQALDAGEPNSVQPAGLLVLLASDPSGYRSLCRLSSHLQGHADREARMAHGLTWTDLSQHAEGLICLTGGRRGWIERSLRAGDRAAAARYVGRLGGIYGENLFLSLELQRREDRGVAHAIVALGKRFGLSFVAVQPVYCLSKRERNRLRLLAAIDHNCALAETPDQALPDGGNAEIDLHWLSPADMAERYADFPDALANIDAIVARCKPALPSGEPIWPTPKLASERSVAAELAAMAERGFVERYGDQADETATYRLSEELAVINEHGFSPLFVIVADVVRHARVKGIPVSTRGSVANSLVAYCTGITTVDPLEHDLLFERFLNPARTSPPDIDLDFCSRRRDEVLNYVRDTYGAESVALVATVSTMQPKSAVRETGKAYGLDNEEIARLSKRLPSRWHPDPRRRDRRTPDEIIEQVDDPRQRQVLRDAYDLVGQPHHLSIHPGGLVITPGPLTNYVPLQWTAKGFTVTQYAHEDVEQIGLAKIDLLGIRALTVIADAVELIRDRQNQAFALDTMSPGDPAVARMLRQGDTIGVFQCESSGAQRTLRQLKATNVRDLAVANAFFKPGPATGGMAQTFVRRYRGEAPTTYLHPSLEPILGATKGVLLFQEQILRVARQIAGLTWAEADHLRRGMSKFESDQMAAIRGRFVAGCQRPAPEGPAFTPAQADTLWEQVEAFAGYGFNQGHATAYANVSYRSAWLKAHWPAEFLCARLQDWGGFHHQAVYIAEAIRLRIPVRPPHVNQSGRKFTLTGRDGNETLWMGLGQVRDLRRKTVAAIITARRQRPFTDLGDLLSRLPVQPKEIRHLIQCGALDGLGESRAAMLAQATDIQRAGGAQQMAFDFAERTADPEGPEQRLAWEQHLLGQPLSVHPLDVAEVVDGSTSLADVAIHPGKTVVTCGVRLPGWTGGKGFFMGDQRGYVIAVPVKGLSSPKVWQPSRLRGRWRVDEWGGGWLQIERIEPRRETGLASMDNEVAP